MMSTTTFLLVLLSMVIVGITAAYVAWHFFYDLAIKTAIQNTKYPIILIKWNSQGFSLQTNFNNPDAMIECMKDTINTVRDAHDNKGREIEEW